MCDVLKTNELFMVDYIRSITNRLTMIACKINDLLYSCYNMIKINTSTKGIKRCIIILVMVFAELPTVGMILD